MVEPPVSKICLSNWIIYVTVRVQFKSLWNHHLEIWWTIRDASNTRFVSNFVHFSLAGWLVVPVRGHAYCRTSVTQSGTHKQMQIVGYTIPYTYKLVSQISAINTFYLFNPSTSIQRCWTPKSFRFSHSPPVWDVNMFLFRYMENEFKSSFSNRNLFCTYKSWIYIYIFRSWTLSTCHIPHVYNIHENLFGQLQQCQARQGLERAY